MLKGQNSSSKLSDLDLIRQYQLSDNKELIGILFNRYLHLIFGVCLKYHKHEENAKDASMEIFEVLLNKLSTHQIENFKGWLHMVVRNHCLMQLRKTQSKREKEGDIKYLYERDMESEESMHQDDERETLLNGLENGLKELNVEQRQCLTMFYLEKKSYSEIIEETGFDFKQVKSFIQNGKRNLKNILSNSNGSA